MNDAEYLFANSCISLEQVVPVGATEFRTEPPATEIAVEEPRRTPVGDQYQCDVEAILANNRETYEDEVAKSGELVWDPTRLESEELNRFLAAELLQLPDGQEFKFYDFDEEYPDFAQRPYDSARVASLEFILQTLHECNYDVNLASSWLKTIGVTWHPGRPNMFKWTRPEIEAFENAFRRHYKDFARISAEVATKTYHEAIEFYYYWKPIQILPRPPSTLELKLRARPRINYIEAERRWKKEHTEEYDVLDDYFACAMYSYDDSPSDLT